MSTRIIHPESCAILLYISQSYRMVQTHYLETLQTKPSKPFNLISLIPFLVQVILGQTSLA